MEERIHAYTATVEGIDGVPYQVYAVGEQRADGTWEGRLLFEPMSSSGTPLLTERETTQPNRQDLDYWASGLEPAFLEGALGRARDAAMRKKTGGAAAGTARRAGAPGPGPGPGPGRLPRHGILDPYEVYSQGEEVLREELTALHLDHLRTIVRAQGFADDGDPVLHGADEQALRERIIQGVRRRVDRPS